MATPTDVVALLLDEFWYLTVLVFSLIALGAYGGAVRFNEEADNPVSRFRLAIWYIIYDSWTIIKEFLDFGKAVLFAMGFIGGSIIWVVFPFFQGDPLAILLSAGTTYSLLGLLNIQNAMAGAGLFIMGAVALVFVVHFVGGLAD